MDEHDREPDAAHAPIWRWSVAGILVVHSQSANERQRVSHANRARRRSGARVIVWGIRAAKLLGYVSHSSLSSTTEDSHWRNGRKTAARCSMTAARMSSTAEAAGTARKWWRCTKRRRRATSTTRLSVITSRALPDVRDGLKPVQRRILYTMWQQNLTADVKHRKCAKVVGDVHGQLPSARRHRALRDAGAHGAAVLAALSARRRLGQLRLARRRRRRGDALHRVPAGAHQRRAAHRDRPVDGAVPSELRRHARPSRSSCRREFPNLLVNGATGIAVGMATNIPPHNLNEVCTALVKLLDNPDLSSVQLCRYVKGPDFPTGAQMLNSPEELKEIYKTGSGRDSAARDVGGRAGDAVRQDDLHHQRPLHGQQDSARRSASATSPPAASCRRSLDVRDVSTDDVRIALELKKDADEKMVMAYLFKHTPLQTSFVVNLTCLIPTENPEIGRPERLDLHAMLWHFLHFRLEVVTKRLEHELRAITQARPHPRRLREGLRCARRDPQDRPQVGRQGRRGAADHEAVRARRGADRRDPRAEDLSARAARDPHHPQGARGEAARAPARSRRCSKTSRDAGAS